MFHSALSEVTNVLLLDGTHAVEAIPKTPNIIESKAWSQF